MNITIREADGGAISPPEQKVGDIGEISLNVGLVPIL